MKRPKFGVRTAYVAVVVAVWFGTLGVLALSPSMDSGPVLSALQWVVGVLGVAVAGDSFRPSGQAASAFTVTAPASGRSEEGATP